MPKVVDEQMREVTRRKIIREAACEFARLGFDQANINVIAEQSGIGKGTIYLSFENKRELFLSMLRFIVQAHITSIRAALAPNGTLQQRLERLFLAFVRLAEEESDSFNVSMSALYGVNHAFKEEATRLLRDSISVIPLLLEESRSRGELCCQNSKAVAFMVLSLTESSVLSARVLGQSQAEQMHQASNVAQLLLQGISVHVS